MMKRHTVLIAASVLVVLAGAAVAVSHFGGGSTGVRASTSSTTSGSPNTSGSTAAPTCQTRTQPTPGIANGNVIVRLDATSPEDVWAVGSHYLSGKGIPLAERWNGTTWQYIDVPDFNNRLAELQDVVAMSPSDAWAVGALSDARTLIYHWNGAAWHDVASPNLSSELNELMGVAATPSGDVWAVGKGTINSQYRTLILQLEGGAWRLVTSPNVGAGDNILRDVVALSPRDVWAVGWRMSPSRHFRTLILHWNGSSWRVIPSPNVGSGNNYLSGIAAAGASDIWTVGWSSGGPDLSKPLTMHWNGARWRIVSAPTTSPTETHLEAVTIGPAGTFAVGETADDASTFRTLVLRYDRSGWVRIPSENGGSSHSFLSGAVATGDQLFAGGTHVTGSGSYESLFQRGCS